MSAEHRSTAPGQEELKACIPYLQQGLFESKGLTARLQRRRVKMCTVCAMRCSGAMIRSLLHAPAEFQKQLFLTNCRAFLIDTMCLLTTLPTAEDEREIIPDVRHAYNTCLRRSDHEDGLSDQDLLSRLLPSLAAIVSIGLTITSKTSTIASATRFGKGGKWPESIADILPGDSSRSALSNLLRCWSRDGNMQMLGLLKILLGLPSIHYDVAAALMDARQAFVPAFCGRSAMLGRGLQVVSIAHPRISGALNTLSILVSIGQVVVTTLLQANVSPHELMVGYEGRLNTALDDAAWAARRFPESNLSDLLITAIRTAFLTNYRLPPMPEHYVVNIPPSTCDSNEDPYTRFYHIVSPFSRESRCWRRGCRRYGQPETLKLMRCARCLVLLYCSRECQRAHWKDEIRPHKTVCAMLARIQTTYPLNTGDMDDKAFSVACRAAGIPVEDLLMPFYHFHALLMIYESPDAEGIEMARATIDPPPRWVDPSRTPNDDLEHLESFGPSL